MWLLEVASEGDQGDGEMNCSPDLPDRPVSRPDAGWMQILNSSELLV
jgi:hypothetical protein